MNAEDAKLIADLAAAEARATKGPWEMRPTNTSAGIECAECGAFGDPFGPSIVAPCPPATTAGPVSLAIADLDGGKTRDEANGALIALARNGLPRLLEIVRAQDAALSVIADRGCRCDVEAEIDPARICCACIAREALGSPAPDTSGEAGEARAEGEAR